MDLAAADAPAGKVASAAALFLSFAAWQSFLQDAPRRRCRERGYWSRRKRSASRLSPIDLTNDSCAPVARLLVGQKRYCRLGRDPFLWHLPEKTTGFPRESRGKFPKGQCGFSGRCKSACTRNDDARGSMGLKLGNFLRSALPTLALLGSVSLATAPAMAQGAQQSAPLDFAREALALKPGEFVWAPEIAPSGPVTIVVDLSTQRATIYRNGVRIGVTTVSTGKPGHETPTGVFTILAKDAHHRSSKYNNAKMPYTQKLTQDGVALHAGGLPGYPESHGCVHLPLALAKQLFASTTYSTTVVISGRAGTKANEVFGGVLAPVARSGKPNPHVPLAPVESYRWRPELAPDGPVAFVLSTRDQRLVVLRNGVEIGRAKVAIDVGSLGTHVLTLVEAADGTRQWVLVGVAGHKDEANLPVSSDLLSLVRMPAGFSAQVVPLVVPGTTVLVTEAPINKKTTGRDLAVLTGSD
jgi:hypothetical protein